MLTPRRVLAWLVVCWVWAAASASAAGGQVAGRAGAQSPAGPNFIIILADDLGGGDLGAEGHPHIRTPALDRLAREGMRFERAFLTCSSCSPSRYRYVWDAVPEAPLTPPADAVRSPTFEAMLRMWDAGRLPAVQAACLVQPRAAEELYDLQRDPHSLRNAAGDAAYADVLDELRAELAAWQARTMDRLPGELTPDRFDRRTGLPLERSGTANR